MNENKNTCITKNKLKKNISKKLEWDFNVPDNKNDILKISSVFVDGFVTESEIKDGSFNLKVTLRANILYVPDVSQDYEPKLCSLESMESFTLKGEIPDMAWDFSDVNVFVKSEKADIINSRKAGVSVNLCALLTLVKNKELETKTPCDCEIERQTKTISAIHIPVMVSEKVNFSHTFTVPNGKPDIKEILRVTGKIKNKEVKAVTAKAVFKGNLEIKILYISSQNTVECFENNVPFTEIADAKGIADDMEMTLSACVKDVLCKTYPNDDNKERNVDVSGYMLFNLCAFERVETDIICDAFSPKYKEECIREEINYSDISKCFLSACTQKDTVTLSDNEICEICDITPSIINKEAVLQNGKVNIVSDIIYDIIYRSEAGIKCERKIVTFQYNQEVTDFEGYTNVDLCSEISNCSYMIASNNSLELRCNIIFEIRLTKEKSINSICEIKVDKEKRMGSNRAPIVTYYPSEREDLFDIAKKYRTTVSSLKEINSLNNDFIDPGTFLIIE